MSHSTTAGRGSRQNHSATRYGSADNGVTVKTLSNINSYSSHSQSSQPQYGPKRLYTGKDDHRLKRETAAEFDSNASKNGEVTSRNRLLGSKKKEIPTAVSVQSHRSQGPANSTVKLDRDRKYSGTDENQEIEVRTHSSSGSFSRSKTAPAPTSNTTSTRAKADRSNYYITPSKPTNSAVTQAARSSNTSRTFTAEKYRDSGNNNEVADGFKRSVHDATLCKLLINAVREDSNQHSGNQLKNYVTDQKNCRSIVKCGQSLWDCLLELNTQRGNSNQAAVSVKPSVIACLVTSAIYSLDAPSRYGEVSRFYQWLFEKYEDTDYENKMILMTVAHETLIRRNLLTESVAQYLVSRLHNLLDCTATSGQLFAILRVLTYLAEHHQQAFEPVFTDVIDILAGWSVGPEQAEDTIIRISQILIALHQYWVVNMVTCVCMTKNFLEDVEGITDDIVNKSVLDEDIPVSVAKIGLLIRLFQTSVLAAGDHFSYKREPNAVTHGYVCECVSRMIECTNGLTDANISGVSKLTFILTRCIDTLADCGEDVSVSTGLCAFMIDQVNQLLKECNEPNVTRLLTLNKLYTLCDSSNLITLTRHILALDLRALKLNSDCQVLSATLDLHRRWFATKDMETIQVAFKWTKECIESCLTILTGEGEIEWSESRADVMSSKQESRELLLFHLSSLSQVATDTNNLILMYSIEPSMFNFLLKDILLAYGDSLKGHTTVVIHTVRLLHLHCNSNKNFIAKSNLCPADTTRRNRHNITVNKSSGDNFSMILESMAELFTLIQCNTKGLVLLTKWVYEIIEQVASLNPPLLNNVLVVAMMQYVLSLDDDTMVESMLLNIAEALAMWIEHATFTPALLSMSVDYTLHHLSSELSTVREKFLHIATLLPVDSMQRSRPKELMKKHNQVLALRRSIMSGCYGSLSVEQFRSVANILLKQYTNSEEIDVEWLQRLLMTAERPSSAASSEQGRSTTVMEQIIHHTGLLEYWLLWQAADFCVAHKLRTPIGKPQDTFMCIEAAIKQIAADNRIEVSPKCGADTKRVWMLLQFMENLEKALYNAYEGAAGQLTTHGKVVRSFFRTNRSTCIEWLTRIRLHILSIASTYGHPATVIRHGYELITDMLRSQSTQTPEFELVLVYLTEAWCQLNCSEAIQGLYEWCKVACNRKLSWLKPFFLKAMNRYEEAVLELKTSLTNMVSPPAVGDSIKLQTRPSPSVGAVNQLCAQQITDCYTSLQSWDEASDWLQEFETMKSAHGVLSSVNPLGHCDKVIMANKDNDDNAELISWSKQQHLAMIWKHQTDEGTLNAKAEDVAKLDKLLKIECSSDWPALIQPNTMLSLLSERIPERSLRIDHFSTATTLPHGLPWLLNLSTLTESKHVLPEHNHNVMIACCRELRRTGNVKLAKDLMSRLSTIEESLKETSSLSLRIAREAAKHVYTSRDTDSALNKMVTISLNPVSPQTDKVISELVARSTLTAAKWLQSDTQHLQSVADRHDVKSVPSLLRLVKECNGNLNDTPTVPMTEKIVGSLLQMSTDQCPSLAKTWHNFGNWAYKWGRKCLDNAEQALSADEIQKIESFLPSDLTRQEKEDIMAVMSMVQGTFAPTDEDLADDSPDYGDDDLQEIRRRLISCCPSLADETIDNLVGFWTITAKRVYTLYEQSAKAYFSYLSLSSNNQGSNHHNVTITLRLLRLLVKHAWELRDVLESGLASTPTAPWRSIIPQLFSRLNHPEHYVRQSVSELLARLADDYPHLIVYPAIVGCNQSARQIGRALSDMESDAADDVEDVEADGGPIATDSSSGLVDCFQKLVEALSSANPLLITQVRTLVNELCRITVLWDEFWLGSLSQLSATASERIKALASEVDRVKNNSSLTEEERKLLITEKRDTVVKPLIHTIERLSEITGKTAETRHEQWFQETFGHLITKGLKRLTHPEDEEDLVSDWQPFKQLHSALQQRSQKRSSHMLKMKDLSGVLASLTDTYIPLPGAVAKSDKQPITLQSVHATLQILPTKTKPKKLAFLGSDGHKYTYLFKGLEDLHLDERIMQLLSIVNDMLVSKGTTDSDCAMYRARHYSVTPLGLRSGLIAWVDGSVPLFSLYKRWQVREAAAKPSGSSTVQRPSEVLYSKLLPLLKPLLEDNGLNPKEVKISDVEKIRKDWPQNAIVTATKQLIAETPSHLVAKEIWCHSTSANEWWNMTQTYCRSVAVMSAIGYILGLGDRHLDNLLLDLNNGEMVHIDYNVCFDKGKSLRVPERVPFRLTNNIVAAMGATGVEGIFRSACEHTMKSMRLGKETLLTLLEAFVYDPLVDWTVGGETGLAGAFYGGNYAFGEAAKDYRRRKKQMERDITRSMFSIRVTEMKAAWLQNRDEMRKSLAELVKELSEFTGEITMISGNTAEAEQCREMLKYIEELKKEGGQAVNRLMHKYMLHQKLVSARDDCLRDVQSMQDELTKYSNLHQVAMKAVTSPVLERLSHQISSVPPLGKAPSSFCRPVFMSGDPVAKLDEADHQYEQLVQIVERRQLLMHQCRKSLARYGGVVAMFPTDFYVSNHVMGDCLLLITQLKQDFSHTSCLSVAQALADSARNTPSKAFSNRVASNERALRTALNADIAKLEKILERSEAEDSDISMLAGSAVMKLQAISQYQTQHGENGRRSVLFIVLPKLAELTKKYLTMENTASKSEKRLHSLTSREGDWFLDEIFWVTDNLLQYVSMTRYTSAAEGDGETSVSSSLLQQTIAGVHTVYTALQDMVLNFQQIILPDILMSLIKGDQSVREAIDSLANDVIKSHDLSKMCSKLETMLRNIIFGTKVDDKVIEVITELRRAYRQILPTDRDSASMTKGKMLIKAFGGLFDHVYDEYCSAMKGVDKLHTPRNWRKIDVIREAGALQLSQYNDKTRHILADLFFVKQMMAMKDFYRTAKHYVNIFKADEQVSMESYEALSRPVKSFIADFVRKQILGVASQSLGLVICGHLSDIGLDVDKEIALKDFGATSRVSIDDLCKKGLDRRTQTGTQLSQANALISGFEAAWKKQDLTRRLSRSRTLLEALVSQQRSYMLCYHWLHGDLLTPAALASPSSGAAPATAPHTPYSQPSRKEILTELHKNLSALLSTNAAYTERLEQLAIAEQVVENRLKWVAGGNPQYAQTVNQFENAQASRSRVLQAQSSIVKDLNTYCHYLLHLETMRTKSQEASSLEAKCKQLISRCLEVCKTLEEDEQITEQQSAMISLMSAADRQKTGNSFLGRAHDAVQSNLSTLMTKLKSLKRSVVQLEEKYQAHVTSMQFGTLNAHHKLISEVRAVLKTLAKEEMEDPIQLGSTIQDYLRDYKAFSEKLTNVIKMASQEQLSEQLTIEITALVSDLSDDIESIFMRLVDIAKPLTLAPVKEQSEVANTTEQTTAKAPVAVGSAVAAEVEAATTSPMASSSAPSRDVQGAVEKVQRDPRTGKAVQERNSYAVSVWRRVKMKLDGRELDPNKKMSVADQVGYIIAEASDIRNLAQMYEGWTSWV